MRFIQTHILTKAQKTSILNIWNNEYPVNLIHKNLSDFENYLDGLVNKNHILLIDEIAGIKGWLVTFTRENERWFVMILDSKVQKRGLGSKILTLGKKDATVLNGWIINHNGLKKRNGHFYESPKNFYKKNGFEILETTVLENENLSAIKIQWKSE
tara:strand:+ start:64118 stop:64585 length:468 start_codon:yes stop_codon:yes gene_type:complete